MVQVENCKENSQKPNALKNEVALQVSRNLYQYFRADAEIAFGDENVTRHKGNVVTIAQGVDLKQSALLSYPIKIDHEKGVSIEDSQGQKHSYAFRDGLGILCLRPLPQERLEIVVWGFDDRGLRYAARLLPMLTVSHHTSFYHTWVSH